MNRREKPFGPGDVVVLKSGGPRMTVESCDLDEASRMSVWVTWFDGDNVQRKVFAADAVEQAQS